MKRRIFQQLPEDEDDEKKHQVDAKKKARQSDSEDEDEESCKVVDFKNKYEGFSLQSRVPSSNKNHPKVDGKMARCPPQPSSIVMEEVDPEITAKEFYQRFVARRRPCILRGVPRRRELEIQEKTSGSSSAISLSEIAEKASPPPVVSLSCQDLVKFAGKKTVQVEKRHAREECFGQNRTPSRQVSMTVSDLVETLQKDEIGDLYYLSTQLEDEQVASSSFHVPCRQLLQANVLDDSLDWAGNLILESCNLWMGCTRRRKQEDGHEKDEGSCSGLHHDFHDNFYLLLHGRKEIRLYSPDAAPYMELRGQIECIHFNGVISYVGKETRPDGVPLALVDDEVDRKVGKEGQGQGHQEEEDDDEEDEVVLGKGFDYVSSSDEDPSGHDVIDDEDAADDYDAMFCPGGGDGGKILAQDLATTHKEAQQDNRISDKKIEGKKFCDSDDDDEDGEEELVLGKGFDYVSSGEEADQNGNHSSGMEKEDVVVDDYDEIFPSSYEEESSSKSVPDQTEGHVPPDHFSRIGNPTATNTASEFPQFWENCCEWVVELHAGQSLYIPAGWFHSVTSFGCNDEKKDQKLTKGDEDNKNDIHMALNYWYHPPDVLDCFDKPYQHEADIRAAANS